MTRKDLANDREIKIYDIAYEEGFNDCKKQWEEDICSQMYNDITLALRDILETYGVKAKQ